MPIARREPNPAAIREALFSSDIDAFDREYNLIMAESIETLNVRLISDFLERWRRVALSSAHPAAHLRMLRVAEQLEAGEAIPTETWSETRARLRVPGGAGDH